jgi:hypothetical protein
VGEIQNKIKGTIMPAKIDNFTFSDDTLKKFDRVGILPETIEEWIADGRANGVSDEGIRDFIKDEFAKMNKPYERGGNVGGGLRYGLATVIPGGLGEGLDEAEALFRRYVYDPAGKNLSYDEYLKNARDSRKGAERIFKEETDKGSWFNRHVVGNVPLAARMAEEGLLAAGTGGATLMPGVAGALGATEGALSGEGFGNRGARALFQGGIAAGTAGLFNRLFPTKSVQSRYTNKLANSSDQIKKYTAKAIRAGTTPEDIIAREVPKGMREELFDKIARKSVGENVLRKQMHKQASDTVSQPYAEYVADRLAQTVPEYADAFNKQYVKEQVKNVGKKTLVEADERKFVEDAINKITKGASEETKQVIRKLMNNVRASRDVAKKLTSFAKSRAISPNSGSMYKWWRVLSSPARNANNYLLGRVMTARTPNYVGRNWVEQLANFRVPDMARGALDAAVEKWNMDNIK